MRCTPSGAPPLDQPNHAELAIKCAFHMRKRLAELHEKWEAEKKELLDNGIGLNTGEVLVANIGAEGQRMKYAAVGDNVNLASRVSGLTRTFKVPIMVSEFTADHVKALMEVKGQGNGESWDTWAVCSISLLTTACR